MGRAKGIRVIQIAGMTVSQQDQSMPNAQSHCFGSGRGAELAENGCDVELHGMVGNREPRRDFFVPQSACEHLEHFAFAR
jgi:hypothetical protein